MHEGNSLFVKIKYAVKSAKNGLLSVLIVVAVAFFFMAAVNNASDKADDSSAKSLERAITRAAVQCYAVEGFYPPSVDYLVENYGVIINEDKYFIDYETFAGNCFPTIKVFGE